MIPAFETYLVPTLRSLSGGFVRDFRSIHADIKWKLGLTPDEVEQVMPGGRRTEVSYGLSAALRRMIELGFVSNPTRTHYQITDDGRRYLERVGSESLT